jgi:hypothetical protein
VQRVITIGAMRGISDGSFDAQDVSDPSSTDYDPTDSSYDSTLDSSSPDYTPAPAGSSGGSAGTATAGFSSLGLPSVPSSVPRNTVLVFMGLAFGLAFLIADKRISL